MKKARKLLSACIGIAFLILVAVVVTKIIRGTFALVGSVINSILGIAVILGLIAIVIFMFSYAKKKRKK
ncbi:MAG: hypothetical protein Q4F31_00750 [Eubacteriales bacterium]|nr:hypothetical protein [Eubacteriales bacterium]